MSYLVQLALGLFADNVPMTGVLTPTDPADTFPITDPRWGLGGYRSCEDALDRDAIPQDRRQEGMQVFTKVDKRLWQLLEDMVTWVEIKYEVRTEDPLALYVNDQLILPEPDGDGRPVEPNSSLSLYGSRVYGYIAPDNKTRVIEIADARIGEYGVLYNQVVTEGTKPFVGYQQVVVEAYVYGVTDDSYPEGAGFNIYADIITVAVSPSQVSPWATAHVYDNLHGNYTVAGFYTWEENQFEAYAPAGPPNTSQSPQILLNEMLLSPNDSIHWRNQFSRVVKRSGTNERGGSEWDVYDYNRLIFIDLTDTVTVDRLFSGLQQIYDSSYNGGYNTGTFDGDTVDQFQVSIGDTICLIDPTYDRCFAQVIGGLDEMRGFPFTRFWNPYTDTFYTYTLDYAGHWIVNLTPASVGGGGGTLSNLGGAWEIGLPPQPGGYQLPLRTIALGGRMYASYFGYNLVLSGQNLQNSTDKAITFVESPNNIDQQAKFAGVVTESPLLSSSQIPANLASNHPAFPYQGRTIINTGTSVCAFRGFPQAFQYTKAQEDAFAGTSLAAGDEHPSLAHLWLGDQYFQYRDRADYTSDAEYMEAVMWSNYRDLYWYPAFGNAKRTIDQVTLIQRGIGNSRLAFLELVGALSGAGFAAGAVIDVWLLNGKIAVAGSSSPFKPTFRYQEQYLLASGIAVPALAQQQTAVVNLWPTAQPDVTYQEKQRDGSGNILLDGGGNPLTTGRSLTLSGIQKPPVIRNSTGTSNSNVSGTDTVIRVVVRVPCTTANAKLCIRAHAWY